MIMFWNGNAQMCSLRMPQTHMATGLMVRIKATFNKCLNELLGSDPWEFRHLPECERLALPALTCLLRVAFRRLAQVLQDDTE